jgi:hypothetical protein
VTLDALLAQLPDSLTLRGEGQGIDVVRVLEVPDPPTAPLAGTLYLAADAAALAQALAWAPVRDVALAVPAALAPHDAPLPLLLLSAPRIPLDFAARVQRALSAAPESGLGRDAACAALIDDVVHGRFHDPVAVAVRARAVGVDVAAARVVLVAAIDDFERFYLQHAQRGEPYIQRLQAHLLALVREEVLRSDPRASVVAVGDAVIALIGDEGAARSAAAAVAGRLRGEWRFVPLALGIGGARGDWTGLPASYREATLALALRRRLRSPVRTVAFDDVSPFALLEWIDPKGEIGALLAREIAPLQEADRSARSRLVETLATYLDVGGSLKRAAERLGVHPKTLRYRLDRIEDQLGRGALEGDERLLLHLAARWALWREA